MRRLLALLIACLALTVVAAGCGGDDNDGGGDNGGGAASSESQEPPAPEAEEPSDSGGAAGGPQVSMKDIKFDPETLKVKAGQTVTWTNDDSVGHDVTGDDFKSGDPGGLQSGDTFQHTFKKAGTFDYVCSVHPGMKGSVQVK